MQEETELSHLRSDLMPHVISEFTGFRDLYPTYSPVSVLMMHPGCSGHLFSQVCATLLAENRLLQFMRLMLETQSPENCRVVITEAEKVVGGGYRTTGSRYASVRQPWWNPLIMENGEKNPKNWECIASVCLKKKPETKAEKDEETRLAQIICDLLGEHYVTPAILCNLWPEAMNGAIVRCIYESNILAGAAGDDFAETVRVLLGYSKLMITDEFNPKCTVEIALSSGVSASLVVEFIKLVTISRMELNLNTDGEKRIQFVNIQTIRQIFPEHVQRFAPELVDVLENGLFQRAVTNPRLLLAGIKI